MPSTIYEALSVVAKANSNALALLTPGKSDTTYAELLTRTERVRARLAGFGVRRGSRVGIVVPTRDAMAAAHLAILSSATSAPLSAFITPRELEFSISDFRLTAVILEDALNALYEKAASLGITVITLAPEGNKAGYFELDGSSANRPTDVVLPEPDDISMLLHTSGTTARPKIVPRIQVRHVRALYDEYGDTQLQPGDRVLNTLPLHHTEGLHQFTTSLLLGASVVIADFEPSNFIDLVEQYRPTKFALVPSMHQMVVDTVKDRRGMFAGTNLRYIETSSAALPVRLRRQMTEVYGVPIIEGYGATEVGGLATMGFNQNDVPEGSVGKRRHKGVVIMDDKGNVLASMKRGEICVNSPIAIIGYENNLEANAAAFRDGYYRTGDEGYLDENDYLFVIGRVTDTIDRGGEKIAPLEVDDALMQHEHVAQAAAFAAHHDKLGQDVWAVVVPKEGAVLDPLEVRAFVSRILSFPRVPKRIFVVDEIPQNEMGKVVRRVLSERYGRAAGW